MARLVIFDIDGTLVNSDKTNTTCFIRSIKEEFGIHDIDERWEIYRHTTDSGILEEIFEKTFGRKPSELEIRKQIKKFLNLLEGYHLRDASLFQEIRGAQNIIEKLKNHPEWKIGIATGTWREAALLKLKSAGLVVEGIPIATSSEARSREDILQKCIDDSKDYYEVNEFQRIVSVGDAIWDLKAASKLNIPFIRINVSGNADAFMDCKVLRDYSEQTKFIEYLEEAEVPKTLKY
jgi:beta-phosphoglucomutase-like phosphatase (HAD superfamily)